MPARSTLRSRIFALLCRPTETTTATRTYAIALHFPTISVEALLISTEILYRTPATTASPLRIPRRRTATGTSSAMPATAVLSSSTTVQTTTAMAPLTSATTASPSLTRTRPTATWTPSAPTRNRSRGMPVTRYPAARRPSRRRCVAHLAVGSWSPTSSACVRSRTMPTRCRATRTPAVSGFARAWAQTRMTPLFASLPA